MKKRTPVKKTPTGKNPQLPQISKAPVSEGKEYDLDIENEKNGFGIGFVKDFPIMVPDVEVGDSVHVQIIKVKKDHAVGRVMSSEEPRLPGENIEEEYREAEEKAADGEFVPEEISGEEE